MRFKDRMGVAWRVLTGGNIRRKAVVTLDGDEGWSSTPSYSEVSFETMVRQGWRKNELIYACIHKAANTAAQVGLKVMDGEGTVIRDHPVVKLLQKPNDYMSEYDFWYSVIATQKLAGRAPFEKVRSRAGKVVELWPLRPDYLSVVRSSRGISGYVYEVPGSTKVNLAREDVLDFPLWDPLSMFSSWPPVAVAARVADVDNSVTDYVKNFFEKGGVPPLVLTSKQQLLDDQVTSIRARWKDRYGGHENWLEPAVLDSEASVQVIGLNFEEMGFGMIDGRDEAKICMVLDVPPILVGAKVGLDRATYSNYVEAERSWWQDSLMPLYANLVDVVENQLAPDFGDEDIRAGWDFTNVWVFQEERNAKWTRAASALGSGGITVNEYRKEIGLGEVSGGEVFLRPMNLVSTTGDGGTTESTREETEEETETEEEEVRAQTEEEGDEEEGEKINHEIHEKHENLAEYSQYKNKSRVGMEREWRGELVKFFEGQVERLRKEVQGTKKTINHEPHEHLAEYSQHEIKLSVEFWDLEDEELERVVRALVRKAVLAGVAEGIEVLIGMGVGIDWALVNEAALRWVRSYTFELVKQINGTTRKVVEEAVGLWIQSGAALDELIEDLAPTFGDLRAEMIAVTEVTRSYAEGNVVSWRESGVVKEQEWRTSEDELVCPICGPLAGKVFPLGDGSHTPPAHVNCRCWIVPVVAPVEKI